MKWFIIVLIFKITCAKSQTKEFEQTALDYYTKVIHPLEYEQGKKYLLKNVIIKEKSSFLFGVCFKDYTKQAKTIFSIIENTKVDSILKSSYFKIQCSNKFVKKKSIISIYEATPSPFNTVFVQIDVQKSNSRNNYYVEMTPNKDILRWCKTEIVY
jgi:hypothetical protein